jgi:chromosome segregation and condensation protein ScpB
MVKVYKESEKAILIGLRTENTIIEKELIERVWVPKSQLDEKGFPKVWIIDKKFEERFGYSGKNGYELRGVEVE